MELNMTISNSGLLDTTQAAAYLEVSPKTLEVWRCNKRYGIRFLKIGNKVRYRLADLDAWLESRYSDMLGKK
jgi:excisionase family DNA binding protein